MMQVIRSLVVGLCWAISASADVVLPGIFTDAMVLQREQPVPVWGAAEPGETIVVSFAGQEKRAVAKPDGAWHVALDPLVASAEGKVLQVGDQRFSDVLVGEVWLCSGQSNMWWPLKNTHAAKEDIPKANHPKLRLFQMVGAKAPGGGAISLEKLEQFNAEKFFSGQWAACTPERAASFSGVAYYFGKQLLEELDVPVGIICNGIGGSPTESWVSKEKLLADPETAAILENWFENPKVHGFARSRAKVIWRSGSPTRWASVPGTPLNHTPCLTMALPRWFRTRSVVRFGTRENQMRPSKGRRLITT